MGKRANGTYGLLDTEVLTYLKTHRDATASVLTALAERHNYTHKPLLSVPEIQIETELGERAVVKCLNKLQELHFCTPEGKLWRYTNPNRKANGEANSGSHDGSQNLAETNDDANDSANSRSENQGGNAVLDSENPALKEVEGSRRKEREEERETDRSPALPLAAASTPEQQGADAPTADAVQAPVLPSQDVPTFQANGGTERPTLAGSDTRRPPLPPVPAPPPTPAFAMFAGICGHFYASHKRTELDRWHAQYTPAFVRLAWALSGRSEQARFLFTDWLDRVPSKPWPDALRAQYEADVDPLAGSPSTESTPKALPVKVGQQLRWKDGVIATVERCDRVECVTDAEDDWRGYVPYSEIGRSVEVLHS
ncbi:hypothetical protein GCM10008957_47400 [Deinococcus ruber]|uniref:Helix-turn-helix domain-containing protein n=2 Tax=Deinococcus ruber TaxID=1848197 RepID=A0A918CP14_9DEIO|nr:hypothetical protein GCM10008957_47400 [Deinococcus ruber]